MKKKYQHVSAHKVNRMFLLIQHKNDQISQNNNNIKLTFKL